MNLIGQTLSGYQVLEQIGVGGMATVYKAYDAATDRFVALKVLPPYYTIDETFRARFTREARAIARLEHPHILPIYGFGEESGVAYLVMRYMPIGTLADLIRARGPLPFGEIARLLRQIAGALDEAHQAGILHRDVKPGNILLDARGNAYLTDFGIAKMVEGAVDLTKSGILGTPAYMSPEQCQGDVMLTAASDLYALAIVLYEMVAGQPPFQAETPLALVLKQLREPLPSPRVRRPDLPEQAERVVLKALAKDPALRWPTCLALADAFQTAIETAQTIPAAMEPAGQLAATATRPAPARRRWGRLAAVFAALFITGGLIAAAALLGPRLLSTGGQAGVSSDGPAPVTPVPTAAPATPVPTAIPPFPSSLLSFSERFDNPVYEGAVDPARWVAPELMDEDVMGQHEGALALVRRSGPGTGLNLTAWPFQGFTLEAPIFVEADLMLDPAQPSGNIAFYLEASPRENVSWVAQCNIEEWSEPPGAAARCWDEWRVQGGESEVSGGHYDSGSSPAAAGEWHTLRVEIDPERMVLTYFVDGMLLGQHVPASAGDLSGATFWLRTGVYQPDERPAGGFVDNVRVGPATPVIRSAEAFAASILDAIEDLPPDYADNFEDAGSGWPEGWLASGDWWRYREGQYRIAATYQPGGECCTSVAMPDGRVWGDFVLEVDVDFIAGTVGSATIIFRQDNSQETTPHYGLVLNSGGEVGLYRNVDLVHTPLTRALFPERYNAGIGVAANHLTLIALGDRIAILINGSPVWLQQDGSVASGAISLLVENAQRESLLEVAYDNLAIWDLTGLEIPGQ
jgi:serine/threonine-protein kinase